MIRKTISMPDEMGDYVEAKVKTGQYGNDSEFFRHLVRKEQERDEAIRRVQAAIDEGFASGISNKTVEEIYQEAVRRYEKRKRK